MRFQTTKHSLKLGLLTTAAAFTLAANVFGSLNTIVSVPLLTGDTGIDVRGITSDGAYVVGNSSLGTTVRGYLYPVGTASSINVLAGGAQSTVANGVGYRTSGGGTELVISGLSSGLVSEFMTANGGTTFGVVRRNAAYTLNTVEARNQLGATTGSDVYYVSSRNSTSLQLDLSKGAGTWPATITASTKNVTSAARMVGVGASGAAVGSRINTGSVRSNYRMDYNTGAPFAAYFNGPSSVTPLQGEAFDVSDNGQYVCGWSQLGTDTANSYAYKARFSGTTWQSTSQLPVTGLETGSTAKTVTYAISPDGRYVGGGSYQGSYHAVLWDTGDLNPANWTVLDLNTYAAARNIMQGWTRLDRVYSVGVDPLTGDPVVAGMGVTTGGLTRAFVMQIPEPTTFSLLGLGALAMLALRRRK